MKVFGYELPRYRGSIALVCPWNQDQKDPAGLNVIEVSQKRCMLMFYYKVLKWILY